MKTIWVKDYAMIFWADAPRDPVEIVLEINDFLNQYGDDYVLKYLNQQKEVAMDRESLEERCAPRRKEGKPVSQSYFSHNGLWFSLSTGVTQFFEDSPTTLPETLKLEFDLAHIQGKEPVLDFNRLQELFRYCVYLFEPYYGRLEKGGETNYAGSSYHEIYNSIDLSKVPAVIEWFNYFGPDMVEHFGGLDKVLAAPVYRADSIPELEGAILILQKEPFDFQKPEHLRRRQTVEDYLNFESLHREFTKE